LSPVVEASSIVEDRREETDMHVLVAYASRHGATQGIAERIAETLRATGVDADARPAAEVRDASAYDAFVIGSAAYMHHWMKEARTFVERNRALLASRPVWLFSSGPIGNDPVDKDGVDQRVASIPTELPELATAVRARDQHVFFGAYERDRKPVGLAERLAARMPASWMDEVPYGDFRDWPEIEAWAKGIGEQLAPVPV
jgi:menaquinone-dependent protoporphyrinogen oxidase